MLVDICVPRNVDAPVEDVSGCFSYNVDHLKQVVAANTAARQTEVLKAEKLLEEDLSGFQAWHTSLMAVPTIATLRKQAEVVRQNEMNKHTEELSKLTAKQREGVEALTQGLVKSLMHQPMVQLNAPQSADEKLKTISEFNNLFHLYDSVGDDDAAIRLLETVASLSIDAIKDDEKQPLNIDLTLPDPSTRGPLTAGEDFRRARSRESVAELGALESLTSGILNTTMDTLSNIQERAKRLELQNAVTASRELEIADHNLMTAPQDVRRAIRREWRAEAEVLDRISRSLAGATMDTVKMLSKRAESVRQKELNKQAKKLKGLGEAEVLLVERISRGIVNTLMAGPTSHLCSPQAVDDKSDTLNTFASLFNIPTKELCALPYEGTERGGLV